MPRIIDISPVDVYRYNGMKADFHAPHVIIDRFVTLLDICQRINSEKNFDDLLNIITSEAAKLIDAERATIFLLDEKSPNSGRSWPSELQRSFDSIRAWALPAR